MSICNKFYKNTLTWSKFARYNVLYVLDASGDVCAKYDMHDTLYIYCILVWARGELRVDQRKKCADICDVARTGH